MRQTTWCLLAALALAPVAAAQEEAAHKKTSAAAEMAQLNREYREAQMAFRRKQAEAARKAGRRRMILRRDAPEVAREFIPKFEAAAAKYAGTDDAIRFLVWLLRADPEPGNPTTEAALATLLGEHIGSAALGPLAMALPKLDRQLGAEKASKAEDAILARNPHAAVQSALYYARASKSLIVSLNAVVDPADKAAALAEMKKALELAPAASYAERARGAIFAAENLAIGKIAPDIEGQDLDGVQFKLSDYRGKVVLLDFWGDW